MKKRASFFKKLLSYYLRTHYLPIAAQFDYLFIVSFNLQAKKLSEKAGPQSVKNQYFVHLLGRTLKVSYLGANGTNFPGNSL